MRHDDARDTDPFARAPSSRGGPRSPDAIAGARGALPRLREGLLVPLWTEIGDLMPAHPQSKAQPHLWRWADLLRSPSAQATSCRSAEAASGVRSRWPTRHSAAALRQPDPVGGHPYLMPGEDAPEHRHAQHAFRFVVEGEGVWTVVGRDPVPMRRGDFLPQAGGTGTPTTTPPSSPWPGSTAWTSPSSTRPRRSSSSSDATRSPTWSGPLPTAPGPSDCGVTPA